MIVHRPGSEEEACCHVAEAAAARQPLAILGGATKAAMGRPAQSEATLSSGGLAGITLHEPAELVIAAQAGTPVRQVVEALAATGQHLPFEPMDCRPLLGTSGEPTIGGLVALNLSGPRRIMAGALRDSLIGLRFVNGRGEAIKSGGRVMKNVTGLDLVKVMAGAWGTLGFLTEATFKVLPIPERTATLVLHGLDDARAVAALSAALGSPSEVSGAAHLPAGLGEDGARTLMRLENLSFAVDYRLGELTRLLAPFGSPTVLEGEAAAALWQQVRDVVPLAEPREAAVWRVSTAPTKGPAFTALVAGSLTAPRWFYDWGGGLVWLACAASGDAGAAAIRAALRRTGGYATLLRAPAEVRAAVEVFEPLPEPVMRLQAGIKASLDPAGIFNPGRMYAGM
jgi:glycolate oxidase FAD binding subunit